MMRHILRPSGKALLSAFLTFGVVFFCVATASAASGPQVILGCDPAVWQAMTAKAEAQVAYDTAVTDELVNKPDSVLTLTCFSDAAGVSAKNGGAIFSGDFTTQLQTIMPVTGGGTYNCTQIGTLETQMINQGVDTGAPFATFNDLMSGTAPAGGGTDFNNGWNESQAAGVFGNLNTAVSAMTAAQTKQYPALNFSAAKSSCDVLKAAGIVTTCP